MLAGRRRSGLSRSAAVMDFSLGLCDNGSGIRWPVESSVAVVKFDFHPFSGKLSGRFPSFERLSVISRQ